jgi:protein associated with RNAse G/E
VLKKNPIVTINSRKYDGKLHRSWKAELINKDISPFEFVGKFENEIFHPHLGVIRRGTISYEFYWLERWYNVFRFHEPDGNLRNFYCNINMPPKFENDILDYVDLDIDIVVWKDFSREILDTDEFEINSHRYAYSDDVREKVRDGLNELISMIDKRIFPFDYKF